MHEHTQKTPAKHRIANLILAIFIFKFASRPKRRAAVIGLTIARRPTSSALVERTDAGQELDGKKHLYGAK